MLRPGESVDASGSVPLKEAGLWKVFPCYTLSADTYCPDLWNVVFVPVSEG